MTPEEEGAAVVAALPASIRIGPYDYRIEKWSALAAAGAQRFGECSICEQTIRVQDNIASRFKAADTFVHEVNHAAYHAFGLEDEDKQERVVNLFTNAWVCIYRDNPWLLDWLKGALR